MSTLFRGPPPLALLRDHAPPPGRALCSAAALREMSAAPAKLRAVPSRERHPIASSAAARTTLAAGSTGAPRQRVTFEERITQLQAFHQEHGHARVPVKEPTGLGAWLAHQRHLWKRGRLGPEHQRRLAALGVSADAFQEAWSSRFLQLAAFHTEHGHCCVPRVARGHQGYPGLHRWLQEQVRQWQEGTLSDERRRRLEGLGVSFRLRRASWETRFAELLSFVEEHGHADVPFQWPPNPRLAAWVMTQRARWRGACGAPLTAAQREKLLSCGFHFDPIDSRWDDHYSRLCKLRRQRGSLVLPLPSLSDGRLAAWMHGQRRQWRRGRLAPDRVAKLEAVGLSLTAPNRRKHWSQRLAQLDALIDSFGLPGAYMLLAVVPISRSAAMASKQAARAAVDKMGGAASGGNADAASPAAGLHGSTLASTQARSVVLWYRGLGGRRLRGRLAEELHARGLLAPLMPGRLGDRVAG